MMTTTVEIQNIYNTRKRIIALIMAGALLSDDTIPQAEVLGIVQTKIERCWGFIFPKLKSTLLDCNKTIAIDHFWYEVGYGCLPDTYLYVTIEDASNGIILLQFNNKYTRVRNQIRIQPPSTTNI